MKIIYSKKNPKKKKVLKFEEKIDTEIERERERGPQTAKDETGTLGGRGSVDGEARGSESDGGVGERSGEARTAGLRQANSKQVF